MTRTERKGMRGKEETGMTWDRKRGERKMKGMILDRNREEEDERNGRGWDRRPERKGMRGEEAEGTGRNNR